MIFRFSNVMVSRVAFSLLGVMLLVSSAKAQFTFTNIVDTTNVAPIGNFISFNGASISNGAVMFQARFNLPNQGFNYGVFKGTASALTTIAKSGDSTPFGAINFSQDNIPGFSNGTAAFYQYFGFNGAIFSGSGGSLTTIVKTGDAAPIGTFRFPFLSIPHVSISNNTVAFYGQFGNGSTSGTGIFTGSGGPLTTIAKTGDAAPVGTFNGFSSSSVDSAVSIDNGVVAFEGAYNNNTNRGIFTGSGGALTTIAKTGDTAPVGTFLGLSNASIHGGITTFLGTYDNGEGQFRQGIFTGNGGSLTTIVKSGDIAPIGTFLPSFSPGTTINGTTIFSGNYGGNQSGVFMSNNGNLIPVILFGSSLFGSTVSEVGVDYDSYDGNNIAFRYSLDDGRSGVAVASVSAFSAPEPCSIVLVLLGTLGLIARRKQI